MSRGYKSEIGDWTRSSVSKNWSKSSTSCSYEIYRASYFGDRFMVLLLSKTQTIYPLHLQAAITDSTSLSQRHLIHRHQNHLQCFQTTQKNELYFKRRVYVILFFGVTSFCSRSYTRFYGARSSRLALWT